MIWFDFTKKDQTDHWEKKTCMCIIYMCQFLGGAGPYQEPENMDQNINGEDLISFIQVV